MRLAAEYGLLDTPGPRLILEHQVNQLIGFERANLIFLFSFNPTRSFPDYPVDLSPGEYLLIMDSDAAEFGGHGRVQPGQVYFTRPEPLPDGGARYHINIYLPTRTALILKKTG
jgi:1,4-alpha-glucan branching enzyme